MDSITISASDFAKLTNLSRTVTELQEKLYLLETSFKPPGSDAFREPRVSDPEYFDGKRAQVRNFIGQVRLVLNAQPSRYATERHKVMFAASFLRSTAFSWFQPFLESSTSPALLDNFDMFAHAVQSTFGDPDQTATAERQLHSLRQTTSVASYATDFRRLALDTQWNDSALTAQFYRGLKDLIKDEIAKMERPTSLEDLIEISIRLDNRIQDRRLEKFSTFSSPQRYLEKPRHSSPLGTDQSPQSPVFRAKNSLPLRQSSSSTAMEIDASQSFRTRPGLAPEERERRRRLNLCLYCGQSGHIAASCNSRPKTSHIHASKAQTQTDLKDQVRKL